MNTLQYLAILLSLATAAASTAHDDNNVIPDQRRHVRARKLQSNAETVQAAAAALVQNNNSQRGFDFVVAGFPKCGTTTLLQAFAAHEETDMALQEQCDIAAPLQPDARVHKMLDNTLSTLSSDPNVKRSFKCPTSLYSHKSISRLEEHSPASKLIVGMRHPVEMLQAFYNDRIAEIKERKLDHKIPTLEEVLERGDPWKGVSMQSTRFDLFLMQLGKTHITAKNMKELAQAGLDLTIKPNEIKVFLYTVDQLKDQDSSRATEFRSELQGFLGLHKPLDAFHNVNHHQVYPESIDICDDQWAQVRGKLVQEGTKTAKWIQKHFMHSNDVVVANQEHFLQSLESWSTDPCGAKLSEA